MAVPWSAKGSDYDLWVDDVRVDWLTESHRQGPLRRATFVCKSWYAAGIRLLYEHASVREAFGLGRFARAIEKNPTLSTFVKTFTHSQFDDHAIYAPNIKFLKHRLPKSTEWRITINAVVGSAGVLGLSLLTRMKNLKEIHLIGGSIIYWNRDYKFPGVETLTMEGIYDQYTGSPFDPVINDLFPNVKVFRFHSGKILLYPYHRTIPMGTSHMHMPNLRELEVIDVDVKDRGLELVQGMMETNAGTLERLVVLGLKCKGFPPLPEDAALGHYVPALNMDVCPLLKDVTFGYFPLRVPFQDVVPGLVFPTAMERLEIRGTVYPWPEKGRVTMGPSYLLRCGREFRPSGRLHFTKMPSLKEIVVYGKPDEVEERFHPMLYDAASTTTSR